MDEKYNIVMNEKLTPSGWEEPKNNGSFTVDLRNIIELTMEDKDNEYYIWSDGKGDRMVFKKHGNQTNKSIRNRLSCMEPEEETVLFNDTDDTQKIMSNISGCISQGFIPSKFRYKTCYVIVNETLRKAVYVYRQI